MLETNARRKLLAGLTILLVPLLGACAPKPLAVAVKPPSELLTCAGEPVAPALPPYGWDKIAEAPTVAAAVDMARAITGARDARTLPYVLDLRASRGDCASKVDGTRAWADALPE